MRRAHGRTSRKLRNSSPESAWKAESSSSENAPYAMKERSLLAPSWHKAYRRSCNSLFRRHLRKVAGSRSMPPYATLNCTGRLLGSLFGSLGEIGVTSVRTSEKSIDYFR